MNTIPPFRKVVSASHVREGRGSLIGPDTSRRTRWRELTLECGHVVERIVKYRKIGNPRGGTQSRKLIDVLPPPEKVRCEVCGHWRDE